MLCSFGKYRLFYHDWTEGPRPNGGQGPVIARDGFTFQLDKKSGQKKWPCKNVNSPQN
jgi:hypothetical protein